MKSSSWMLKYCIHREQHYEERQHHNIEDQIKSTALHRIHAMDHVRVGQIERGKLFTVTQKRANSLESR